MVVNKLDILTFDNSNLQEEGNNECNCWGNLTFSILEIIVIGVLSMAFLTGLVKLVIFLRGKALKRKETLRLVEEKRELELRRKIQAEISAD